MKKIQHYSYNLAWPILVSVPFLITAINLRLNFGCFPNISFGLLWAGQYLIYVLLAGKFLGLLNTAKTNSRLTTRLYGLLVTWLVVLLLGIWASFWVSHKLLNPVFPLGDMNFEVGLAAETLSLFTIWLLETVFKEKSEKTKAIFFLICSTLAVFILELVLAVFRFPTMTPIVPETFYLRIFSISLIPISFFTAWIFSTKTAMRQYFLKKLLLSQMVIFALQLAILFWLVRSRLEAISAVSGLVVLISTSLLGLIILSDRKRFLV